MLEVHSINYSYGQSLALSGVSLTVGRGEIVSLLGMNGAGKTTLLNIISGVLKPSSGRVVFDGREISGLSPEKVVGAGVVQAPEGRQVFAPLSVEENLELGAYLRLRRGKRREVENDKERILTLFPPLRDRLAQQAGTLSGGEQQMLAMGRALMAGPKLLLLDEPSLGLAPLVSGEIFRTITRLGSEGVPVLLVEQNALGALAVSQRGYIITGGRIRRSGTAEDILKDEMLREAFLGPERVRKRSGGGGAAG